MNLSEQNKLKSLGNAIGLPKNVEDMKLNLWNGFSSNLPKYEHVIKNLILKNNISHIIEIGCFLGNSTIILSKLLKERNIPGFVYAIDCWDSSDVKNTCVKKYEKKQEQDKWKPLYEQFLMNCLIKQANNVVPVRNRSEFAAESFKIDHSSTYMLYIDGDHSFEGVSKDLNSWWKIFKSFNNNLLICGDDWNHIRHKHRKRGIIYEVDHRKEKIKKINLLENFNSFLNKAVIKFSKENKFKIFVFGKLWWLEKI